MSQYLYPSLPGVSISVTKTPMWSTKVHTSASGREQRGSYYSSPRYKISLKYEILRSGALAEFQNLIGFFNARRGSFESFLWQDPEDFKAVNQVFGIGDGVGTQFQLVRTLGEFAEPVHGPHVPTITVTVNGSPAAHTVDNGGRVTFAVPPAAGALVRWSGQFYYRVRFASDQAEFERFLHQLWSLKKIEFTTVKDRT